MTGPPLASPPKFHFNPEAIRRVSNRISQFANCPQHDILVLKMRRQAMTVTYPTSLFPGDYLAEANSKSEAFELCAKDLCAALKTARLELEADGFNGFILGVAEFDQFDSGNIFHASAHFTIEIVSGITQPEIDAIFA
jgi:hypothetical protein